MNAKFEEDNRGTITDQSDKFARLLTPSKVFRDPIHGDIFLNDLELKLVDTDVFQRLRSLKQLGLADLIYPAANHTRFEHSIGTLHMAQRIIDSINKNPFAAWP